jgi:ureidoglycolate hydrolase
MTDMIKVKVQPLTAEAMRPYGQMLESKQPIFPEVEPGEGRVAMELLHIKHRPAAKRMDQMAIHFSYNQTFIPVQGSMVLLLAPAPRNREAGQANYEFDYERVAAFLLEPGQAALIDKGVWHNALTFGPECTFINVTRKDPGEGTSKDVQGRVELVPTMRSYVEFVDLQKRDNRTIELEL